MLETINYNIIGYAIYLPVTFYITVHVGRVCYRNGEVYLNRIINDSTSTVKAINALLLTGYYLINLGYAAITLGFWPNIDSWIHLTETISTRFGQIILFLGIMHFNNMLVTYLTSRYLDKPGIHKTKNITG
jgi:hypothetical protein